MYPIFTAGSQSFLTRTKRTTSHRTIMSFKYVLWWVAEQQNQHLNKPKSMEQNQTCIQPANQYRVQSNIYRRKLTYCKISLYQPVIKEQNQIYMRVNQYIIISDMPIFDFTLGWSFASCHLTWSNSNMQIRENWN